MINVLKYPLMDEDWGDSMYGTGSIKQDTNIGLDIYKTVEKFFISIDGGFCEQTDDSDLTNDDLYQVLEFLTSNYVFTTKKESEWNDTFLALSIRYDNEFKIIEDISFTVSFFNSEINDDSMKFTRCYSVNISIEDFVSNKDTTLNDYYENFKSLVAKFIENMLYN